MEKNVELIMKVGPIFNKLMSPLVKIGSCAKNFAKKFHTESKIYEALDRKIDVNNVEKNLKNSFYYQKVNKVATALFGTFSAIMGSMGLISLFSKVGFLNKNKKIWIISSLISIAPPIITLLGLRETKKNREKLLNDMFMLGYGYLRGRVRIPLEYDKNEKEQIPYEDEELAKEWFKKVVEKGFPEFYASLSPSQKEKFTHIQWLKALGDLGLSSAQFALGELYHLGEGGCPKDQTLSVEWTKKAADQKFPEAEVALGNSFEILGQHEKAAKHYKRGEKSGSAIASFILGEIAFEKAQQETNQRRKKALERQGVEYYKKAAEKECPLAAYALGVCYLEGKGVRKSNNLAKEAFKNGCHFGSRYLRYYPTIYEEARSVALKDHSRYFEWLKKAASLDDADSLAMLGIFYFNGDWCEKNDIEAKKNFEIASQKGDSHATAILGRFYENGLGGCPVDPLKAFQHYEKASKMKKASREAFFYLGCAYLKGVGCIPDLNKGKALIFRAAKMGHPEAKEKMKDFGK